MLVRLIFLPIRNIDCSHSRHPARESSTCTIDDECKQKIEQTNVCKGIQMYVSITLQHMYGIHTKLQKENKGYMERYIAHAKCTKMRGESEYRKSHKATSLQLRPLLLSQLFL